MVGKGANCNGSRRSLYSQDAGHQIDSTRLDSNVIASRNGRHSKHIKTLSKLEDCQLECLLNEKTLTYVILVENPEAGARKFGRVAVGKKLLVDAQETRLGQLPVWTILSKASMPLFNFSLGNCEPIMMKYFDSKFITSARGIN